MSDDFKIEKNNEGVEQPQTASNSEQKIIDEANYHIRGPREKGPSAIGRGGIRFSGE